MKHLALRSIAGTLLVFVLASTWGCTTIQKAWQRKNSELSGHHFMGTWRVTYTNDAIRSYEVVGNDTVRFVEENQQAKLQRRDGVLLEFNDEKIERWRLDGKRLLVEHWDPASRYPEQEPTTTGIGIREPKPSAE